jgi:hypothetical protein
MFSPTFERAIGDIPSESRQRCTIGAEDTSTDTQSATHPPDLADIALAAGRSTKRMKGFEPSTFAMARRKRHADARK